MSGNLLIVSDQEQGLEPYQANALLCAAAVGI